MTTIHENEVHGENYILGGRYGYTAIDRTYANGTGVQDCITGIKPNKMGREIIGRLQECQSRSTEALLLAIHMGDSANSAALYLWATNDGDLYRAYFHPCIERLRTFLSTAEGDRKVTDLQSIVRTLCAAFYEAIETYRRSVADDDDQRFNNYTRIDVCTCVHQWLEHQRGEYAVNGLK